MLFLFLGSIGTDTSNFISELESFVNDDVEEVNGVLVELPCCIPDLLDSAIRR